MVGATASFRPRLRGTNLKPSNATLDQWIKESFRPRLRGTNLKPGKVDINSAILAVSVPDYGELILNRANELLNFADEFRKVSVPDYGELILNDVQIAFLFEELEGGFRPRLRGTNLKHATKETIMDYKVFAFPSPITGN